MRKTVFIAAAILLMLPIVSLAAFDSDQLPDGSTWYFHIDFNEMRGSKAGKSLYEWLDSEIFEEVREETGVDIDKEIDLFTAFDSGEEGPIVVLQGRISRDSKDKIMAAAAASGDLSTMKSKGKTFYFFSDDDDNDFQTENVSIDVDSFDNGAYFSFAVKNKIILTPSRAQMEAMLANGGKVRPHKKHANALLVLSAERNLLQAGANAEQMQGHNGDWDSNILRNTKQLAVLVADAGGKIAIDARLEATEPEMADSLASIARGLISLAALSDDMDPEVAGLLRNTRVGVDDNRLKISLAMDPDTLVSMLDD